MTDTALRVAVITDQDDAFLVAGVPQPGDADARRPLHVQLVGIAFSRGIRPGTRTGGRERGGGKSLGKPPLGPLPAVLRSTGRFHGRAMDTMRAAHSSKCLAPTVYRTHSGLTAGFQKRPIEEFNKRNEATFFQHRVLNCRGPSYMVCFFGK